MNRRRICAVLTAHNRREKTLGSLETYFAQGETHELRAVLMDDGSTDGTAAAIAEAFPRATVLVGDGSLYWNRGMAASFRHACEGDDDFYLWLNDDTILLPGAVNALLETYENASKKQGPVIVVGSTRDPVSAQHTYGGVRQTSSWHPGKFAMIAPDDGIQECDAMKGNIVLIPREVPGMVGGIDESFSHSMGDYDYGLRARRMGVRLVVGPGFQGECMRNPPGGRWDQAPTFRERLGKANSPKGLPLREWAYFLKKHGSIAWPLAWAVTYRRLFVGAR